MSWMKRPDYVSGAFLPVHAREYLRPASSAGPLRPALLWDDELPVVLNTLHDRQALLAAGCGTFTRIPRQPTTHSQLPPTAVGGQCQVLSRSPLGWGNG